MTHRTIYEALEDRILTLDGGTGTSVRHYAAARGATAEVGTPEHLGIMCDIHRRYLEAGADIIETDIGYRDRASAMSAARTAREAADEYTSLTPCKPRFVAGAIYACDVSAASQAEGFIDGGADMIILETATDTHGLRDGLDALEAVAAKRGERIPVIVSATTDGRGTLPSGETVEEFYTAVSPYRPLAIGFNCSQGPQSLLRPLARLAEISEFRISAYPSTGLPDVDGNCGCTPEVFAEEVEKYMRQGLVNIIGGCCGTGPEHIALLARAAEHYTPRPTPKREIADARNTAKAVSER